MKNPIRRFKQFLAEIKDQKLCREYLGQDKYGNKYYQYYSPYGLPTKRMVQLMVNLLLKKVFRLSLSTVKECTGIKI